MASRSNKPQRSAGRRGDVVGMLRRATHPLAIADIADQLGVHPNTVRFHLDTLVANGQAERVSADHRTPGRPPQLFQAVAGMDPAGPRHYQLLAEILADTLTDNPDPSQRVVEAGRAWGQQHAASHETETTDAGAAVGRLVTLLDDLDFAPERGIDDNQPEASAPRIDLRNCPFLELARNRPQVACPLHLGLMQGAMHGWHSPVTVQRLEAFVEPDRCVAHLGPSRSGRSDTATETTPAPHQ